jgi:LAO/AO transport system kinase
MIADVSNTAKAEELPAGRVADAETPHDAARSATTSPVEDLIERMRAGDVRALARGISLVEDGAAEAGVLIAACARYRGDAVRVGITGPPGAGKSTLVDQLARHLRAAGRSVGVVAVDPTSPYTGGALLGDRIRMQGFAADSGVYIRSLASRGARGGLAQAAAGVCSVMEAAGRGTILIETMGVGQDEIEVVRLADLTVLVLVPGMGDDVQSLKAGIMEAADIYVVNKADRGGAERVEAEIAAMQELGARTEPLAPILRTVASSGEGVGELLAAIDGFLAKRPPGAGRNLPDASLNSLLIDTSLRLDHIGIAVRSIASSRSFYEALGMRVSCVETVEHEQVRTAMLSLGESRLELLEPLGAESTIGRFLAGRGEGMHHIALHAGDLESKFERLQEQGVRLVSDAIRVGAGGHGYFFVHPSATGGVLVEIVGDPPRNMLKKLELE